MFKMTIDNTFRINDNISFGGPCENKNKWTHKLIDESGNVYETYILLGKDLVTDDSRIALAMKGAYDIESLKGRELRGICH